MHSNLSYNSASCLLTQLKVNWNLKGIHYSILNGAQPPEWLWISLRASRLPLDFLNDVWNSVPKPLLNRGTLHMPIRGHSFWKHSCLRGQTHVAWVCVCDSPDSQETWFSCHTAPDCYTACVVCLTITRIPPTETSEDATDSSAAPDQQMWKAFLYLLTYFYPFKGCHSGGFQASVTWPESPERWFIQWFVLIAS